MDNREETLAPRGLEGERARKIAFDDPTIEHVMRRDDRRGTIAEVVRVLLVQRMTELLILERIFVVIVVTRARGEMRDRDQEVDDARRGAWLDHLFFFSSGCDSRARPAKCHKAIYAERERRSHTDDAANDETPFIPFLSRRDRNPA